MDLPALNVRLDSGDAAGALADALACEPHAVARDRLHLMLFIARSSGVTGAAVEALRAALQARALAVEFQDAKAETEALLAAGAAHQRVDEHAAAIAYFNQAEALIPSLNEPHLHNGLLRRMGVSCSMLGRHEQALAYITRSIEVLPADAPAQDRMSSRNSLINAYSRRADADAKTNPDQCSAYAALLPAASALATDAEREGCHRIAALAEANYGTLLVKSGQYQQGIDALTAVFDKFKSIGLRADKGAALGSIGNAHLRLGQYEHAIAAFRESLTVLDGGSVTFQRDVWDGIGEAHEKLDQAREALAALKKARALEQQLVDTAAVADLEKHELRSDMARVTAELAKLADEDSLTGLHNRRAVERALNSAFSAGKPQEIALLFVDLDHFKVINDRFGHAMGDRVLKNCAALMRQISRVGDVVARWGGEEFLLVLMNTDGAQAREVAERLRTGIERHDWAPLHP
ncbi:MAG: diguanylate cyclase, partial [Usitatibacteraceae bacterium]